MSYYFSNFGRILKLYLESNNLNVNVAYQNDNVIDLFQNVDLKQFVCQTILFSHDLKSSKMMICVYT